MPDLSIIVPFHSNEAMLRACLHSLFATIPHNIRIVVVQNSPVNSPILNFNDNDRITVVDANRPIGYSAAVNLGVSQVRSGFVGLCDADTVYTSPWCDAHLDYLRANPDVGITSSKLIDPRSGRIVDYGIGVGFYHHFHPFLDRDADVPDACRPMRVQAACSASMVVRRDVFTAVGGFDERYQHYYQDIDFCLRARQAGYATAVVPDALVYHYGSSAAVSRGAIRKEMSALHFARHRDTIQPDAASYLSRQLDALAQQRNLLSDYHLLNLSSILAVEEYTGVLESRFRLHTFSASVPSERDGQDLDLIKAVGLHSLFSDLPLLYLVDRFVALERNALWLGQRRGCRDLIVDRHCNVIEADALIPGQPPTAMLRHKGSQP